MTAPRKIVPGRTYLLTRRCVQRQFLVTPSRSEIHEAFVFCLAYAAAKFDVEIHAAVCLGNHYHIVATDTKGLLSKFMHWLNRSTACCVNVELGRWGALWEDEGFSYVWLVEDADVIAKMLYTFANPVEAALVEFGHEWPGFRTAPDDIGTREFVAKKPRYYANNKAMPDELTLVLTKPPQFKRMGECEFRESLNGKYEVYEEEARKRVRREGRKFFGARRIVMQDPTNTPWSHEGKRGLNPRIACKRKWPRIEAIEEYKTFQKEYREALVEYRRGNRKVIFPWGTWWMRVFHGVECHPAPLG